MRIFQMPAGDGPALGGASEPAAAAAVGGSGDGAGAPAGNNSGGAGAAAAGAPAAAAITFPDNWKEGLTEEFRKEKSLEAIRTVDDLAKSYIHAQKQMGKDKIVIPDPKFATDDDMQKFYQKLGNPADLKDYKLEAPKGTQFDEGFLNDFKAQAHKNGVLPAQAQKLLNWYNEKETALMNDTRTNQMNEITKNLNEYKAKVGAAYEKRVHFANRTIKELGGPDVAKMFADNPALGNNPHFIETFAKIGEKLFAEDTFDGSAKFAGVMSPDEATSRINEIMKDKSHPYWSKEHPKNAEALKYMNQLFEYQNS